MYLAAVQRSRKWLGVKGRVDVRVWGGTGLLGLGRGGWEVHRGFITRWRTFLGF